MVSNQIIVREQNDELPVITRAKQFITEHQTEELSLEQVAKSVNTSKFYFCKVFKKSTGINFTDYLSRVRTERAKNLLLNPNLRHVFGQDFARSGDVSVITPMAVEPELTRRVPFVLEMRNVP